MDQVTSDRGSGTEADWEEQGAKNTGEKHRYAIIPKVTWGGYIGLKECPYMRRWLIQNRWGTLRVHHFMGSDDYRAFHDHPWWFLTLVVKGSYRDLTPCSNCKGTGLVTDAHLGCFDCMGKGYNVDKLVLGSMRFRRTNYIHRVESKNAWTIVITGPWSRHWGFWHNGQFSRWKAFLGKMGFAPCED